MKYLLLKSIQIINIQKILILKEEYILHATLAVFEFTSALCFCVCASQCAVLMWPKNPQNFQFP